MLFGISQSWNARTFVAKPSMYFSTRESIVAILMLASDRCRVVEILSTSYLEVVLGRKETDGNLCRVSAEQLGDLKV